MSAARLDPGLGAILDEGLALAGDHVLLARHAPFAPPWRPETFADATYYEGSVNHVHVPLELVSWRGRRDPTGQAVAYAAALREALSDTYPRRGFEVSVDAEHVVRFHERRDDEPRWGSLAGESELTLVSDRFYIVVESPQPGIWGPNIHLHAQGELHRAFPGAFYWDFDTRSFPELPPALREIVYAAPGCEGGLSDAYAFLGVEWIPWPRYTR
jgi:hypothetical protein